MSDGGASGLSGTFELVGQAAQQGTQKVAQGVGSAVTSAVKQVTGTGGVSSPNMSGSFDLKPGASQSVDLFAPDAKKPASSAQQMFGNTKPLTQAGKDALTSDRVYTPEELEKIQSIETELKSMHAQHTNIQEQMDEVRRKREETYQERLQDQAQPAATQQLGELEQTGQQQNIATFQAQRGTELAKGNQG